MDQKTDNSALLVMDMQAGILGRLSDASKILINVSAAIAHARVKKIHVIYIVVGFRQGAPEISMNNKGFAIAKESFGNMDMTHFMNVHEDLEPLKGDIIVVKRRVSAFAGSDLEVVLRSLNIQHIILTGIATSGVVLSTLREAADKDYKISVISNCCADGDEEVHKVLTEKVFPRQAEVLTLDEWLLW